MGELTWESLNNFIANCLHDVVNYARRNHLLGLPKFKGLEGYLDVDKWAFDEILEHLFFINKNHY